MATEYDLFDSQHEFLIAVDYRDPDAISPEMAWVRVRLADAWDLAGSNVTALRSKIAGLFTERFVPEFTMLSLDHKAMLNTTVGQRKRQHDRHPTRPTSLTHLTQGTQMPQIQWQRAPRRLCHST